MNSHRYIDFLAKLAIDSAHPGGSKLTEAIVKRLSAMPGTKVLDVGCGTGSTCAMLTEHTKMNVVGIDLHPVMVKRAQERSQACGHPFKVAQASAEAIPFGEETFDWVLSESVTAFTDCSRSIPEYFRVLKPGGTFIAIEMTIERALPEGDSESIRRVYGVSRVLTESNWISEISAAGFEQIEALTEKNFALNGEQFLLPVFQTNEISEEDFDIWLTHLETMQRYRGLLSYRVYQANKPAK